jgi:hypothetical protein
MGEVAKTAEGERYDEETGEVLEAPKRRRAARELTPEELQAKEERRQWRTAKLRALEALSPALPIEGETVHDKDGVIEITKAVELTPLLKVPRTSGRGGPGSSLILSHRAYDGMGGGEAKTYAVLFAEYHDFHGYRCRTRGVAVRHEEMRAVASALVSLADALDAGQSDGRSSDQRSEEPGSISGSRYHGGEVAMPKPTTGQVLKNADGLSARVRIAGHHPERPSFSLAGYLSDEQAEDRTLTLASWARALKAHASPDEIARLCKLGAAAKDEDRFADVVGAVAEIASGKTKSTVAALAPTFGKWAEEWTTGELHKLYPDHVRDKNHGRDKETLRLYLQPVAFTRLADFTLDDAERVMKALPSRLAARTRKGVAQCMRKVLSLAVYPGRFITQNPIPREWMPKVPKTADKAKSYLYPEELAKLLGCKEVALERRIAYGILAHEGMRASELERLKWRDVDLEKGRVKLDENKTADPRSWALDPSVTRALTWWKKRLSGEDGDFVLGGLDLGLGARWLQGKTWHPKTGKSEEPGDLHRASRVTSSSSARPRASRFGFMTSAPPS